MIHSSVPAPYAPPQVEVQSHYAGERHGRAAEIKQPGSCTAFVRRPSEHHHNCQIHQQDERNQY